MGGASGAPGSKILPFTAIDCKIRGSGLGTLGESSNGSTLDFSMGS
jgi:hypothetical protein